jgi:hypothetical protein
MSKQRFTLPTTNNTIRNIITDEDGNELDVFETKVETQTLADGSIATNRTAFSKILADGSGFNPGMATGNRPERIGSCYFCRRRSRRWWRRRRSSLVNLRFALYCERCGRLGCRHHVRRSPIDGRPRCRWCNVVYRITRAIKPFFFYLDYEEI